MLSIEGYVSLKQFYEGARVSISMRMSRRFAILRQEWDEADHAEEGVSTSPIRSHSYYSNMEIAAQYLLFNFFLSNPTGLSVLTQRGDRLLVPPEMLHPLTTGVTGDTDYVSLRREHLGWNVSSTERLFGVETLKTDFWVDLFLFKKIFDEHPKDNFHLLLRNPSHYVSLIDWASYGLDLAAYRRFSELKSNLERAWGLANNFGFDPPLTMQKPPAKYAENFLGLARLVQSHDGCPLIAPVARFEELMALLMPPKTIADENATTHDRPLRLPKEALVAILDSGQAVTKQEVRTLVLQEFPEMSHRRFIHFWNSIAEERPELRRPGRKPDKKSKQRIETDFN